MKYSKQSFLKASSVAFVLAGIFATTLHELSHLIASLVYGLTTQFYSSSISPDFASVNNQLTQAARNQSIVIAAVGPIFSLVSGLLLIHLLKNRGRGFARLLGMWLGFLSAQIGFGYFVITPFVKGGDTGYVLDTLHAGALAYVVVFAIGAFGTYWLLPKMFGSNASRYVNSKKEFFSLGVYPWLIGTGILTVVYTLADGMAKTNESFDVLSLAAVLTIGIFTPIANYKGTKVKVTLSIGSLLIPLVITLVAILALIVGLGPGITI